MRHHTFPLPLFRFLSIALLLSLCWSTRASAQTKPAPAPTGNGETRITIPAVIPGSYTPEKVGIPTFTSKGLPANLTPAFFRDVIYRDLEWFADFAKSSQPQQFLDEADKRDVGSGQVDFAEWGRQDCNYVLKGDVSVEAGLLTAEVRFYSVLTNTRLLGLRYRGYPLESARKLAHRISDDVIKAIRKTTVGVCNTQIAFVSRRGGRNKEIWVMDADGENQTQLTHDASTDLTPCWGLNGTEIYYTTYKDTNPDLCAIQLATGKWWWVSRRPGLNYCADWCPGTQRIALTLGRDGNDEIYSMDRTGKDPTLQRLTHSPAIDTSPSWSPDGSHIVFNSSRSGYPQVHVMDADGNNERRLTLQGSYNVSPSWSPKGDRIAFVGQDKGTFDVYTMNLEGLNWIQLTQHTENSEDPTWSPDGEHLVFSSNRTGEYQIYIMRAADGKNLHQLTNTGVCESPAWGPASPY
jgi:TolB protein